MGACRSHVHVSSKKIGLPLPSRLKVNLSNGNFQLTGGPYSSLTMASGAVPLSAPPGLDPGKARPSTSAQYLLCGQLDRHVRQLLQKHRFFDAPVRDARLQLRNSYVAVLLGDHALSQVRTCRLELQERLQGCQTLPNVLRPYVVLPVKGPPGTSRLMQCVWLPSCRHCRAKPTLNLHVLIKL